MSATVEVSIFTTAQNVLDRACDRDYRQDYQLIFSRYQEYIQGDRDYWRKFISNQKYE